ncbi:MAG: hypothetical protein IT464_01495 [Planctomycetes bacterium]|nr:hypothetical protein [Planctomycetota bacterium]
MNTDTPIARDNQGVGNAGLFFVCYSLAMRGWNVLPTSRNAKGIDVIVYDRNGTKFVSIQVKTLSKRSAVPLGERPTCHMAQVVVVCRLSAGKGNPELYFMKPSEIDACRHQGDPTKSKAEKSAFWLQAKDYENFPDRWDLLDH